MNKVYLSFIFFLILNFSFVSCVTAAGICPVFEDGTVLLGLRKYRSKAKTNETKEVWSALEGRGKRNEKTLTAAFQNFYEKTGSLFLPYAWYEVTLDYIKQSEIKKSYTSFRGENEKSIHTYFVKIPGQKPNIQPIEKSRTLLGKNLLSIAHKGRLAYFTIAELLASSKVNTKGRLSGERAPLDPKLRKILNRSFTQNALRNFISLPNDPTEVTPDLSPLNLQGNLIIPQDVPEQQPVNQPEPIAEQDSLIHPKIDFYPETQVELPTLNQDQTCNKILNGASPNAKPAICEKLITQQKPRGAQNPLYQVKKSDTQNKNTVKPKAKVRLPVFTKPKPVAVSQGPRVLKKLKTRQKLITHKKPQARYKKFQRAKKKRPLVPLVKRKVKKSRTIKRYATKYRSRVILKKRKMSRP